MNFLNVSMRRSSLPNHGEIVINVVFTCLRFVLIMTECLTIICRIVFVRLRQKLKNIRPSSMWIKCINPCLRGHSQGKNLWIRIMRNIERNWWSFNINLAIDYYFQQIQPNLQYIFSTEWTQNKKLLLLSSIFMQWHLYSWQVIYDKITFIHISKAKTIELDNKIPFIP